MRSLQQENQQLRIQSQMTPKETIELSVSRQEIETLQPEIMNVDSKLDQLSSFGFPFKLDTKEISLFTEGDFFDKKALKCAVNQLTKSLQSSKTTNLSDVSDNVVQALKRKFSGNTWFCQIVPQQCEVGLPSSLFIPGNYVELSFTKNSIDYRVSVGKI